MTEEALKSLPKVGSEKPEIRELGAPCEGVLQTSDRRLYLQLQAFGEVNDANSLIAPIKESGLECVLYLDINDPYGIGLLMMSEDPKAFVGEFRDLMNRSPFLELRHKPEWTMLGSDIYSLCLDCEAEIYTLREGSASVVTISRSLSRPDQ